MQTKFRANFLILGVLLFYGCYLTPERVCSNSVETEQDMTTIQNNNEIEGYPESISVSQGESLAFKVHTTSERFSYKIIEGISNQTMLRGDAAGQVQNYKRFSFRYGSNWETSFVLKVPETWRSGIYFVKLINEEEKFYIPFIVKSKSMAPILIIGSTNTWAAYNSWGGASFYVNNVEENCRGSQTISFDRVIGSRYPPNDQGHTYYGELNVLKWLYLRGFEFNLVADIDLHKDSQLLDFYDIVLINTHGEYWSSEMYSNLESYLNNGGHLLSLAGNSIYWKVTIQNQQMESMRQQPGEPHTHTGEIGGQWRDLGRPESRVLGTQYTSAGYDTYMPFRVLNESHWIMDGTNLSKGDIFLTGGAYGGGSGWETDKVTSTSPPNVEVIARGENPNGGGADMVYYDHYGGGAVFSAGSITFGSALREDERMGRMLENIINTFLQDD